MRKVTVELRVKMTVKVDEGIEVSQVIDEMDYQFADTTGGADVEDTELLDYEVTDCR